MLEIVSTQDAVLPRSEGLLVLDGGSPGWGLSEVNRQLPSDSLQAPEKQRRPGLRASRGHANPHACLTPVARKEQIGTAAQFPKTLFQLKRMPFSVNLLPIEIAKRNRQVPLFAEIAGKPVVIRSKTTRSKDCATAPRRESGKSK